MYPSTLKICLSQTFADLESENKLTVINTPVIRERFNTPTSFQRTCPMRIVEEVLIGLTQASLTQIKGYHTPDPHEFDVFSPYTPEFYRLGNVVLCRQWLYTDQLPECLTHMTFRFNMDNDTITVWFEPKFLDLANNQVLDDFERTLRGLNQGMSHLDLEQFNDVNAKRKSKYAGYTTHAYIHVPTLLDSLVPNPQQPFTF